MIDLVFYLKVHIKNSKMSKKIAEKIDTDKGIIKLF